MRILQIIYSISLLILPVVARLGDLKEKEKISEPHITGKFVQIYNSKFVDETSEIDWNCVSVNITNHNNTFLIEKNGFLHKQPNIPASSSKMYELEHKNNTWNLIPKSKIGVVSPILEIKFINNDDDILNYMILTGKDNLTMFLFATNYTNFVKKYENEAKKKFNEFKFNSYYKYPKSTYGSGCDM